MLRLFCGVFGWHVLRAKGFPPEGKVQQECVLEQSEEKEKEEEKEEEGEEQ